MLRNGQPNFGTEGTATRIVAIMTTVAADGLPHMPDTRGTANHHVWHRYRESARDMLSQGDPIDVASGNSDTGKPITEPRTAFRSQNSEYRQSAVCWISMACRGANVFVNFTPFGRAYPR